MPAVQGFQQVIKILGNVGKKITVYETVCLHFSWSSFTGDAIILCNQSEVIPF